MLNIDSRRHDIVYKLLTLSGAGSMGHGEHRE